MHTGFVDEHLEAAAPDAAPDTRSRPPRVARRRRAAVGAAAAPADPWHVRAVGATRRSRDWSTTRPRWIVAEHGERVPSSSGRVRRRLDDRARRGPRRRRRRVGAACAVAGGDTPWVFHRRRRSTARRGAAGRRAARRRTRTASLTAPMPATVVARQGRAGRQRQRRATSLIVLEAMKMELPMRAPRDGRVAAVHCRDRASSSSRAASLRRDAGVTLMPCPARHGRRSRAARRPAERGGRDRRPPTRSRSSIALSAAGLPVDRGVGVRQPEVGAADGRRRRGVRRHHAAARRRATPRSCRTSRARARASRPASTRSPSSPPRPRRSASATSTGDRRVARRPTARSASARRRAGLRVRAYVSTAFGCPFEGRRCRRRASRAVAARADRHGRVRGRRQRHDRHRASRPGAATSSTP